MKILVNRNLNFSRTINKELTFINAYEMKNLIKIEEAAMFGFSIILFTQTEFAWWWYALLILAPDIGMLGYLAGNKIGAWMYNLFHHKAVGLLVLSLGWYISNEWVELAGIILFGHSSLDRILGYGLKYMDSFKHTHLGWLGSKV
jgi:hypothetical protein